jgi:hypothetical protein
MIHSEQFVQFATIGRRSGTRSGVSSVGAGHAIQVHRGRQGGPSIFAIREQIQRSLERETDTSNVLIHVMKRYMASAQGHGV